MEVMIKGNRVIKDFLEHLSKLTIIDISIIGVVMALGFAIKPIR